MNKTVLAVIVISVGVIFALLAIIVPACIAFNGLVVITEGDDIKPNGQMTVLAYDDIRKLGSGWFVEYGPEGKTRLSAYRLYDPFGARTVNRVYESKGSVTLNRDHFAVGFNVAKETRISVTMDCTNEKVHTYFLSESEYKEAVGSKGKVDTSKIKEQTRIKNGCLAPGEVFTDLLYYDRYWYLVFANEEDTDVTVNFQYTLEHTVYDVHDKEPLKCSEQKCSIPDLWEQELLVIDYPCEGDGCPESIKARIAIDHPNWAAVAVTATLFSLFAIALLILGIIFFTKNGKESEYLLVNQS